jgi:hypothetical protein
MIRYGHRHRTAAGYVFLHYHMTASSSDLGETLAGEYPAYLFA